MLWLGLIVWLISRAVRQQGVLERLQPKPMPLGVSPPEVAVVVPARDESSNIELCLRSLCDQHYPEDRLRILVVDDHSSDDTAEIVARLIRRGARIVLLRAPELPHGWKGKAHACWVGAASVPASVEWLCFMDADVRAHPLLIASAVYDATSAEIDLLSLAPRQELRSFCERLLIPCGLYLLGFSQDLAKAQQPDSPDVVATGQFMLACNKAFTGVDGFADPTVRSSICEDIALARLLKRRGCRVLLKDGGAVSSVRMYDGWRTLWPGIAKNLTDMLGGPARTLVVALCAVVLAWTSLLLPLLDLRGCLNGDGASCVALVPATIASIATFALHLVGAAHFGIPLGYGFLFPLGYTAGALLALDSVRWRLRGRVYWKGRAYP